MSAYYSTTWVQELQRLANGGLSYPSGAQRLDAAAAANAWAGTSGLDLLDALNAKAGNSRTAGTYRDLPAVCNQLGSTTGLQAPDALRARAS